MRKDGTGGGFTATVSSDNRARLWEEETAPEGNQLWARTPIEKRWRVPGCELFPSLEAMVPGRDLQQLRRRRLSYGVGALSLPPCCGFLRGDTGV